MSETANKIKLTVGQKLLCVVPSYRSSQEPDRFEVVVVKVGTKWATVKREGERYSYWEDRADMANLLQLEGRGWCYVDREAYETELARLRKWERLQQEIGKLCWHRPAWVTDEWIDATLALLPKEEAKS